MIQQKAIVVRDAIKRYGKGELVLDRLNMTVARGSVYGLLGASGCGKTTLLSCIVGIRYLNSGEMWVLGGTPGSKNSGIPGPRVGFVPQNTSLIEEFSLSNALYYFGRINGLNDEEIEEGQTFFSELLELPPADRLVKDMSGGQQRRVSLAAALIHKPELLILDEPTVGFDPILREKTWAFLIKITQEEGVTVLITTHYIEETKDANKIGFLRRGKLLTESAPHELLEQFQFSFLEEVFLKLCEAQDNTVTLNERCQGSKEDDSDIMYHDQDKYKQTEGISEYKAMSERRKVSQLKRFRALLVKNGIQFLRNYTGLFFAVIFPIFLISLFFMTIGGDPQDIKIGIVNDEAGNCDFNSNFGTVWNDEIICHFGNLSCRFLQNFNDSVAKQEYYDDFSEARRAVQNGKLNGIIYFNQNFSEGVQMRVEDGNFAKDSDLDASQIQVFLDMGDGLIGLFVQKKIFVRFLAIYKDIMRDCKYSTKLTDLPIQFEDPIYGPADLTYKGYVIPGLMITIMFFLTLMTSVMLIIEDRLGGVWDRSIVQGVRTEEILLSHILIETVIVIIYCTQMILACFAIWNVESKGSILIVIVLIFLNGFSGLMFGFVISVMCKDFYVASYIALGSFLPITLFNGSLWPLEGLPKLLRWCSYALPTTLSSISLRALIYKGSSIFDSEVYYGISITLGWILLYFFLTIFGLKLNSRDII